MSAVFEKLGYDPEIGVEIFNTICERLHNKQIKETRTRAGSGEYATNESSEMTTSNELIEEKSPDTTEMKEENAIEHRMDLDDFMTAAIEVDDSLIQAIQLVTRRRLFRMIKQRGASLPSTPGSREEEGFSFDAKLGPDSIA